MQRIIGIVIATTSAVALAVAMALPQTREPLFALCLATSSRSAPYELMSAWSLAPEVVIPLGALGIAIVRRTRGRVTGRQGALLAIAFSLLVVTPNAVAFLLSYARPGLQPMISIGAYVDFLVKFTLAFGAVFEVPLGMTLAARMGLVTPKALARNRKYAVLGAFIAAAILTPTPDVVNQSLMAGPIIVLYEIGIVCAKIFGRRAARAAAGAA